MPSAASIPTVPVVENATAGGDTVDAQQTAVIPHTIPVTPPSALSLDARLTRMEGMLMDLLASSAAGDDRTAAGSQHALPAPSVIAAAPVAGGDVPHIFPLSSPPSFNIFPFINSESTSLMPNTPCTSMVDGKSPSASSIVNLRSWNMDRSFLLHMSSPETHSELMKYDFNLFQETHLSPHQHDAAGLPDGYSIVSRTRRPKANLGKSWGGVATISNTARVPSKLREDLSGPDFMVHQIGNIVIYNVYLLPETKSWVGDLESDPCPALASSLAVAYAGAFHILIMGDLNARTSSQTPSVHDPLHHSLDKKPPSTRGRFLFKLCTDYNLMIINGVERFGPNSGKFTSFQGSRKTVIDYAICSKELFPKVKAFGVEPRILKCDHVALILQLEIDSSLIGAPTVRSRKRKREDVVLPDETELDRLIRQVAPQPHAAFKAACGVVLFCSPASL
ncbi:hypothetical protein B0H14DRAFT_2586683 [Mycena olivaceomarginata]|nr:hypothetical protein B0H14DRAFT_2586683 [Mycena olivaceomarginata]